MTLIVNQRERRRVSGFYQAARRTASRLEPSVARAYLAEVRKLQARLDEVALRQAVASRNRAMIEAAAGVGSLESLLTNSDDLERALSATLQGVGRANARILSDVLRGTVIFNGLDPNTVLFARTQTAELVRGVGAATKEAIRNVIAAGAEHGLTVTQQARAIRAVVGLPPSWSAAPVNFAQELRDGQIAAATSRRLSKTDVRRIETAARRGAITEDFVEEMQTKYAASLTQRRALNIARTETMRAANGGQLEAWRQAVAQGQLPRTARRFVIVTPDDRLRYTHAQVPGMNPEGVPLDEPFDTPWGRLMSPPWEPLCRCGFGLILLEELFQPSFEPSLDPGALPGETPEQYQRRRRRERAAARRAARIASPPPSPPPSPVPSSTEPRFSAGESRRGLINAEALSQDGETISLGPIVPTSIRNLPMVGDDVLERALSISPSPVELSMIRRAADAQESVELARVQQYLRNEVSVLKGAVDDSGFLMDAPALWQLDDGTYLILEGHHRIAATKLAGRAQVAARVVRTAPAPPPNVVTTLPTPPASTPSRLPGESVEEFQRRRRRERAAARRNREPSPRPVPGATPEPPPAGIPGASGQTLPSIGDMSTRLHEHLTASATREIMAKRALQSHITSAKASEYRFGWSSKKTDRSGAHGTHHSPFSSRTGELLSRGKISLSSARTRGIHDFFDRWQRGARSFGEFTAHEVASMRTLVHETMHAVSFNVAPRARPLYSNETGRFIEEGLVEHRARRTMQRLVGGSDTDWSIHGSYYNETEFFKRFSRLYGDDLTDAIFAGDRRAEMIVTTMLDDLKKNLPAIDIRDDQIRRNLEIVMSDLKNRAQRLDVDVRTETIALERLIEIVSRAPRNPPSETLRLLRSL